jgi:hypothetical protein
MKLADINPALSGVWFKHGRCRKVGQWTFTDTIDSNGVMHRLVAHHGTVMGEFAGMAGSIWAFYPVSTGWGSASDQQGMNKIMPNGWKFRRNGGHARYEYFGEIVL